MLNASKRIKVILKCYLNINKASLKDVCLSTKRYIIKTKEMFVATNLFRQKSIIVYRELLLRRT
jgi:hypothetical protein